MPNSTNTAHHFNSIVPTHSVARQSALVWCICQEKFAVPVAQALLPFFPHLLSRLPSVVFTATSLLILASLSPAMWYLWMELEAANANFFYAITLLWAAWQVCTLAGALSKLRQDILLYCHGLSAFRDVECVIYAVTYKCCFMHHTNMTEFMLTAVMACSCLQHHIPDVIIAIAKKQPHQ